MLRPIRLLVFILLTAPPAFAHDDGTLDPHNGTPGVHLELGGLPRGTGSATARYGLRARGLPPGVILDVWAQDFGHPFHRVASGLRLDESGNVVSTEPATTHHQHQANQITFGPGPYPRGAAWTVALVSADRAVRAFAAVIPNPIIARDGPCIVQLELVSYRGDRFVATGAGFAPGAEVITESRYSGRVIQKRQRASPQGLLPLEVISHETISVDPSARYVVTCQSCKVVVDYDWGKPALFRH
jgi:hypothetical protein